MMYILSIKAGNVSYGKSFLHEGWSNVARIQNKKNPHAIPFPNQFLMIGTEFNCIMLSNRINENIKKRFSKPTS